MWERYTIHETLLEELFKSFDKQSEYRILDAGSGRTSLFFLTKAFPNSQVTAIIYPGDQRKIDGITQCVSARNYLLEEISIENFIDKREEFDIVLAHLLLGEATMFGNTFHAVLSALFNIRTHYLVIVDMLEDPDVDYRSILKAISLKGSLRETAFVDRYIGFLIEVSSNDTFLPCSK